MIGSVEIKTNKVRFPEIMAQERPFSFRLPSPPRDATLKAEIAMLGLIYPITVEAINSNHYVIIDGHRRFDAISALRNEQGGWDEIPAVIYKEGQLLTHEKLILLKEKNLIGENAYKVCEKARLFDAFFKRGLSLEELAEHSQRPLDEIQNLLFLMEAPQNLFEILNDTDISDEFALLLIKRYEHWLTTPFKDEALAVAKKIVGHLKEGKKSLLSWKFLLDFYWAERPFMAPRVRLP